MNRLCLALVTAGLASVSSLNCAQEAPNDAPTFSHSTLSATDIDAQVEDIIATFRKAVSEMNNKGERIDPLINDLVSLFLGGCPLQCDGQADRVARRVFFDNVRRINSDTASRLNRELLATERVKVQRVQHLREPNSSSLTEQNHNWVVVRWPDPDGRAVILDPFVVSSWNSGIIKLSKGQDPPPPYDFVPRTEILNDEVNEDSGFDDQACSPPDTPPACYDEQGTLSCDQICSWPRVLKGWGSNEIDPMGSCYCACPR